jgi:hypothetical protein
MNADQINQVINELAAKLGPLGRTVWDAYVRQQLVVGYQELGFAVVLLVVMIGLLVVARMVWNARAKAHLANPRANLSEYEGGTTGALLSGAVCLCLTLLLVSDGIAHLVNPQYGAVQALLGR